MTITTNPDRDLDANRRQRVEVFTHRIIGWSFLVLALYVTADSLHSLLSRKEPDRSVIGVAILVLSVAIMPVLAIIAKEGFEGVANHPTAPVPMQGNSDFPP